VAVAFWLTVPYPQIWGAFGDASVAACASAGGTVPVGACAGGTAAECSGARLAVAILD